MGCGWHRGDAKAFVEKVIGYENAGIFSGRWIKKLLLVSSNWGGRTGVGPAAVLADNTTVPTALQSRR